MDGAAGSVGFGKHIEIRDLIGWPKLPIAMDQYVLRLPFPCLS